MKLLLFSILVLAILGTCYSQTGEGYTPMLRVDYNANPLITSLRYTGVQFILERAVEAGRIPNSNFTIRTIHGVSNRTTDTTYYYNYNISLVNVQNDTFTTAFVMQYFPSNETNRVMSYTYSIRLGTRQGAENENSAYVPVPVEEYNDTLIQTLANFGKDHLVSILISNNRIPDGTYNITNLTSVLIQPLTTGALYQFVTIIAQEDGSFPVRGEFRERYENATGNMTVIAYRPTLLFDPSTVPAANATDATDSTDVAATADDTTPVTTDETTATEDAAAVPIITENTTTTAEEVVDASTPTSTEDATVATEEVADAAPISTEDATVTTEEVADAALTSTDDVTLAVEELAPTVAAA